MEILGAPIGDHDFCANYVRQKAQGAKALLDVLPELEDPQTSLLLLRQCGSFCKLKILPVSASYNAKPELEDPQISLLLLRQCGSFCKLAHRPHHPYQRSRGTSTRIRL
jgi:hypothetical protein